MLSANANLYAEQQAVFKEQGQSDLPNVLKTINKILAAIGKEDGDTKQLGDIYISRGEIRHTISSQDSYYTSDFINLLLYHLNQAPYLKVYPAITIDKVGAYAQAIGLQDKTYAFIPLNVAYDEASPQHKNHWAALMIDKQQQLIFYLDPAQKTLVLVELEQLKTYLGYRSAIILNPIDFQQKEKQEGWIRHCGAYVVEMFQVFGKYFQSGKSIADDQLANKDSDQESISLQAALSEIPCGEAEEVLRIRQQHIKQARKFLKNLKVMEPVETEVNVTHSISFEITESNLEQLSKQLLNDVDYQIQAKAYHLASINLKLMRFLLPYWQEHTEISRYVQQICEVFKYIDEQAMDYEIRKHLNNHTCQIRDELKKRGKNNKACQKLEEFILHVLNVKLKIPYEQISFQQWKNIVSPPAENLMLDMNAYNIYECLHKYRHDQIICLQENYETNLWNVFSQMLLPYLRVLLLRCNLSFKHLYILINFLESLEATAQQNILGEAHRKGLWSSIHQYIYWLAESPEFVSMVLSNIQTPSNYGQVCLKLLACQQAMEQAKEAELLSLAKSVCMLNQQLADLSPKSDVCSLFKDYRSQLKDAREVFHQLPAITAQKDFTQASLALLNSLLQTIVPLLGEAPCDYAIFALGSSSRGDRFPYSDIELSLVYRTRKGYDELQSRAYVFMVASCLELQVIRLGETHQYEGGKKQHAGFHLDDSSHWLIKKLGLVGPIDAVFHYKVMQLALPTKETEMRVHDLIDDESLYSLLKPVLVNQNDEHARGLLKEWQARIKGFLDTALSPLCWQQLQTRLSLTTPLAPVPLARQALAWGVLLDVLEKSQELISKRILGEAIDIKKAYAKPFIYFALALKWRSSLTSNGHPYEMLQEAITKGHINKAVGELLQAAMMSIAELRSKRLKKG